MVFSKLVISENVHTLEQLTEGKSQEISSVVKSLGNFWFVLFVSPLLKSTVVLRISKTKSGELVWQRLRQDQPCSPGQELSTEVPQEHIWAAGVLAKHQKCCGSEEGSSPIVIVSPDLQSPWPSAVSTHSHYFISSVRIFGAYINSQLLKSGEMWKKKHQNALLGNI